MTKQTVTSLLRKAQSDKGLWARLDGAKTVEDVVAAAAEAGYGFTVEELQEVLEEMRDVEPAELQEDELEKVAGGVGALPMSQRNYKLLKGERFLVPHSLYGGKI